MQDFDLTLLTATGARPAAWAICEQLMLRQTFEGRVRWIVVDDGPEMQPLTFKRAGWVLDVIRPRPYWAPGQNTQARNLLAGLEAVDASDRLVIIEDDDWYSPEWLRVADDALHVASLIGETHARYYNVRTMTGRQLGNTQHASLCSTAMRGQAIKAFRAACQSGDKFIDMRLWRSYGDRHLFRSGHVVGIKGLPGRGGIGMGHSKDFAGQRDRDGRLLRQWIGVDARMYESG